MDSYKGEILDRGEFARTIIDGESLVGDITNIKDLVGNVQIADRSKYEKYSSDYDVTPSIYTDKTLDTKNKLMTDDLVINKVPFEEFENSAGGKTVVIG